MWPVSALQTVCWPVFLCGIVTSSHSLLHPRTIRLNQRKQVFVLTLCLLLSSLCQLHLFFCICLLLICPSFKHCSLVVGMVSYLFCCSLRNLKCTDSLRTLTPQLFDTFQSLHSIYFPLTFFVFFSCVSFIHYPPPSVFITSSAASSLILPLVNAECLQKITAQEKKISTHIVVFVSTLTINVLKSPVDFSRLH